MKSVELKFPVKMIKDGNEVEMKYLTPTRLKMKHVELLPKTLLEGNDGKVNFTTSELIPLLKELTPFLAGIFEVTEEAIKNIDFDDIENVINCLEEVFPKDEKKK